VKGYQIKFTVKICNSEKSPYPIKTIWPIFDYPEHALKIYVPDSAPQRKRLVDYMELKPGMRPPENKWEALVDLLEIMTEFEKAFGSKEVWNPTYVYPGACIPYEYVLEPVKEGTWTVKISSRGEGTSIVEEEMKITVVSQQDAIKNVVIKSSSQSIKTSDSLDLLVGFNVDLSILSYMENVGLVPSGTQIKPPQIKVELFEEKGFLWFFDKKIAEKSMELESEEIVPRVEITFRIHGTDLGWWVFRGGEHKLYAKITVEYCIGERTCLYGLDNNWGTLIVESPRITVLVKS